jgi:CYTH domain-containing protein
MPKEIERKYLLDLEKWGEITNPPGQHYRQGYLSTDPHKTIRVRFPSSQRSGIK